jgi:hypothetical protein
VETAEAETVCILIGIAYIPAASVAAALPRFKVNVYQVPVDKSAGG